ncbi:glycoside hydrolase [Stereum hirsutum FP-91666 SS1]|uniref:glycoside hydrolase n=1 Tax=Stereum hirsutum (strain FP-91666) TaxID=721885 RepID=UPI000440DBD6|nr:glycoside hydrolase [Stereum hirsutum FP-91666 SS1]EIM90755.1 glycoside hydrolase [Stereum hirsutum FP-91666 SS1]
MFSLSFKRLAALLSTLAVITSAVAVPVAEPSEQVETRDLTRRLVTSAPRFVVYQDAWVSGETGPPATSSVTGYNVFAMSFLLASGSADQVTEWQTLTADQRSTIRSQYNAAGIALVASAFGGTEQPTSSGYSATTLATTMGQWVLDYDVDGIDIDYEDLSAFDAGTGSAENWLISFTQTIRTLLPQGQYIVTHAPLAPWFAPNVWGGGGYLKVHSSVGSLIDWYNVQFYNQGVSEYTTCSGLLTTSSSTWPETALFQIVANGVESDKLVIGKPATTADASNGYIDPSTLATCVSQAKSSGWDAGVMVWQYPNAPASWIATVRGSAFPISGGGGGSGTTTTTAPTTTTTGSSGSGCSGASAWSSSVAYVGGSEVSYNGHLWTAQWWTEADTPGERSSRLLVSKSMLTFVYINRWSCWCLGR